MGTPGSHQLWHFFVSFSVLGAPGGYSGHKTVPKSLRESILGDFCEISDRFGHDFSWTFCHLLFTVLLFCVLLSAVCCPLVGGPWATEHTSHRSTVNRRGRRQWACPVDIYTERFYVYKTDGDRFYLFDTPAFEIVIQKLQS